MRHFLVTDTRMGKVYLNLYRKSASLEWTDVEPNQENNFLHSLEKNIKFLTKREFDSALATSELCVAIGIAHNSTADEEYVLVLIPDTEKRICKTFLVSRVTVDEFFQHANEHDMFASLNVKVLMNKISKTIQLKLLEHVYFISNCGDCNDQAMICDDWDRTISGMPPKSHVCVFLS